MQTPTFRPKSQKFDLVSSENVSSKSSSDDEEDEYLRHILQYEHEIMKKHGLDQYLIIPDHPHKSKNLLHQESQLPTIPEVEQILEGLSDSSFDLDQSILSPTLKNKLGLSSYNYLSPSNASVKIRRQNVVIEDDKSTFSDSFSSSSSSSSFSLN